MQTTASPTRQSCGSAVYGTSTTNVYRGGSGGLYAIGVVKRAVERNAADVDLLFIGDSTGDASTEWIYLLADWLGDQYPTHSVDYYLWDDGAGAYAAASALSTGTGSYKINVWNASVAGTMPMYLFGDKYAAAIGAITPAAIWFNHGHNLDGTLAAQTIESGFSTAIENLTLLKPGIPVVWLKQNPRRDDDVQTAKISQLTNLLAAKPGMSVVDTYQKFLDAGKPSAWYTDNIHPNATGSAQTFAVAKSAWRASTTLGGSPTTTAWLSGTATNLITNGDFASFGGAVPTNWTASAGLTTTKDLVEVVDGHSYSVQIDSTGTNLALTYTLTAPQLASVIGQKVSLAARCRKAAGSASDVCRIAVDYRVSGVTTAVLSHPHGGCNAGWFWNVLRDVEIPASADRVRVFIRNASTGTAQSWVDRVVMTTGPFPRDAA